MPAYDEVLPYNFQAPALLWGFLSNVVVTLGYQDIVACWYYYRLATNHFLSLAVFFWWRGFVDTVDANAPAGLSRVGLG